MRVNPEINARTHALVSNYRFPIDGRVPIVASPTVNIESGLFDNEVRIFSLGFLADDLYSEPRRLNRGSVQVDLWKSSGQNAVHDYRVLVNPEFDQGTEDRLLSIWNNAGEEGQKCVYDVVDLALGTFTPEDGLKLYVADTEIFGIPPEGAIFIDPSLKPAEGQVPSDILEYNREFLRSPFYFECLAAVQETKEHFVIDGEAIEGPVSEAYNVLVGVRFSNLFPENLHNDIFTLIDSNVAKTKDFRKLIDVYIRLEDVPLE